MRMVFLASLLKSVRFLDVICVQPYSNNKNMNPVKLGKFKQLGLPTVDTLRDEQFHYSVMIHEVQL